MQTLVTADAILKDDYQEGLWNQINEECVFFSTCRKRWQEVDSGGRKAVFAIKHQKNQNARSYSADPVALELDSNQGYDNLEVLLKRVYHGVQISRDLMALASTNKDAFVSGLSSEMDGLKEDFKTELNYRTIAGNPSDIWLVLAAVAGAPTYDVKSPWNVSNSALGVLLKSMQLRGKKFDLYEPGPGALRDTQTVVSVDTDNDQVTFDGAFAGHAIDDVLIPSGETAAGADPGWSGLPAIIDDFTGTDPFQTIDSTDPAADEFASPANRSGGILRPLTENLLNRSLDDAEICGGERPDIFWMHPYMVSTYASLLTPDKRFMATREVRLPGGYSKQALTHNGIPLMGDKDHLRNRIHGVVLKNIVFFHRKNQLGQWMESQNNGGILQRVSGGVRYEAVFELLGNLGTNKRNGMFLLDDLEEAAA